MLAVRSRMRGMASSSRLDKLYQIVSLDDEIVKEQSKLIHEGDVAEQNRLRALIAALRQERAVIAEELRVLGG
jgi:hypothetical protein